MLAAIAVIAMLLGVAYVAWSLSGVLLVIVALPSVGYLLPQLLLAFAPPQNLKKKYGGEWAVVTGGSTGIGKAIAKRLLTQNINVVIVALPSKEMQDTVAEFQKAHADLSVLAIEANLGTEDYMPKIVEQTAGLNVAYVFCNAGFVMTGFCHQTAGEKLLTNHECNATAAFRIAQHFATKMTSEKVKGCIVFTSSPAMCMPSPFTALYSSTKAYVSTFAASLAGEIKSYGIDVMSVHPSPVNTNFYQGGGNFKLHQLDAMDFFKKFAVPPEALPDRIFAAVGRCVWLDIGLTAMGFRLAMKLLDFNCLATIIAGFAHLMDDFKKHNTDLKKKD